MSTEARKTMASVLVVDDEPAICTLLSVFLTTEGYHVRTAANGREALASLERGPRPDLILLDLNMPILTGREVIHTLRANQAWRSIPVVVLTASAPGSAVMPPAGTFSVLLHKPFDLDELLAIVNRLIGPLVSFDAVASC